MGEVGVHTLALDNLVRGASEGPLRGLGNSLQLGDADDCGLNPVRNPTRRELLVQKVSKCQQLLCDFKTERKSTFQKLHFDRNNTGAFAANGTFPQQLASALHP